MSQVVIFRLRNDIQFPKIAESDYSFNNLQHRIMFNVEPCVVDKILEL